MDTLATLFPLYTADGTPLGIFRIVRQGGQVSKRDAS